MAEAESSTAPLNGDAVLEVAIHNLESSTELVVLPKEHDNDGADVCEDAEVVQIFPDDVGEAGAAPEPTGIEVNSGHARSSKEKSGSHTYVVSGDSDDDQNAECITMYRGEVIDVSDNSDSSDSDTSSTVSDDNDDSDNVSIRSSSDKSDTEDKLTSRVTRTRGELTVQDLPPIEDLKISVDENQCKPVGSVLNIVDEMVVIQSFPNTPALDIDTVLFLDRGQRALGKIFDVFGPVQEPFYSVRFNSHEHIQERDIRREQVVYCAPQTKYTSYIPVAQLLKEKGSDASWSNNNEPPETYLDFSDDEAEARHKRPRVNAGSKRDAPSDNDLFVKQMNQRNLELTAKRKKEDEARQKRGSALRKATTCPGSQPAESLMSAAAHPFTPTFSKSRTFRNGNSGDQLSSSGFYHHPASAAATDRTHSPSKFDSGPAPRAMNYLRSAATHSYAPAAPPAVGYAFPTPQHFVCSSARQLPSQVPSSTAAAAASHNYLAMFQRSQPVAAPTTALSMAPSPYAHFTAAAMPMPGYVAQPHQPASLHPAMPASFNAAVPPPPPPFAAFSRMSTPPLPSSLPQPSFFAARPDAGPVHPAFMRSAMQPAFHPPFVLPPPPPPPPGTVPLSQPQQQHQREATTSRVPERRSQPQSSHPATNTFYPSSPSNS